MAFQGALTEQQVKADPQQQLRTWRREHDFAVCIDTDGCVLDNMWAKQVVVFHPHYMDMNGLREMEMLFRIHAEHHNLWASTRGCDRYIAVGLTLQSLLTDRAAQDAGCMDHVKDLLASVEGYVRFVEESKGAKAFGIPSLTEHHRKHGLEYNVTRLLGWSEAVDRTFQFVTLGIPPFDAVPDTVRYLAQNGDILVVSATPYSDLADWWTRTGLARHVQAIAGKEMGKKDDHIRLLKQAGGYADDRVIMVGDGGGDLKAARVNKALFYPTVPGKEQEAWAGAQEAFGAFFAGRYRGAMEDRLVADFDAALLKEGPWQKPGYDPREEYRKLQDKRVATYRQLHPQGKLLVL
jgi:phosphoglycolate phosphatase-like HAD superfamily hydrolase